jgi:hypothetical protein
MKKATLTILVALMLTSFTKTVKYREEVELVCVRRHSTSNTCHYNFKIAGANYRFIDVGCKGKKDVIVKKANEGELGLAKDWKIVCAEPKVKQAN